MNKDNIVKLTGIIYNPIYKCEKKKFVFRLQTQSKPKFSIHCDYYCNNDVVMVDGETWKVRGELYCIRDREKKKPDFWGVMVKRAKKVEVEDDEEDLLIDDESETEEEQPKDEFAEQKQFFPEEKIEEKEPELKEVPNSNEETVEERKAMEDFYNSVQPPEEEEIPNEPIPEPAPEKTESEPELKEESGDITLDF